MEDLFSGQLPDGERPDIQLYIFPHLQEFLAVDLREEPPRVVSLNSSQVFDEEFFRSVESEFSQSVREESPYTFAHLINFPLRLEEIIRGVAMSSILERLGIDPDDDEELPSVVVFIISGGALAMHSERLIGSLRDLLGGSYTEESVIAKWEGLLTRLVSEENAALQKINREELSEAMRGDTPDYFTLWENRN
ncbi:MAG: hypothetical protein ACE5Q6_06520 [Dehalococcoidia bacterium]